MKKMRMKNLIITLCACFIVVGFLFTFAVALTIDPKSINEASSVQKSVSTIFLNTNNGVVKDTSYGSGISAGDGVLKIGERNVQGNVGSYNSDKITAFEYGTGEVNSVNRGASIIGGMGNANAGGSATLILGGKNNEIPDTVVGSSSRNDNSVIIGGENNVGYQRNSAVIASSEGYMENSESHGNSVMIAVNNGIITGANSAAYAGENVDSRQNNTLMFGSNINANHAGVFVFNGYDSSSQGALVNTSKENTVVINSEHGLVIGTGVVSTNTGVKLTVQGAIMPGDGECTTGTIGTIYNKTVGGYTCLCGCAATVQKNKPNVPIPSPVSLSNSSYCKDVCQENRAEPKNGRCGTRAGIYENGEYTWRSSTTFCAVGQLKNFGEPVFPTTGMVSQWICSGEAGGDDSSLCIAIKKTYPEGDDLCGSNARVYSVNEYDWPYSGRFCNVTVLTGYTYERMVDFSMPMSLTSMSGSAILNQNGGVSYVRPVYRSFPRGGSVSWTCYGNGGTSKTCTARRGSCNHCAKNGFPYCFNIDFSQNCNEEVYLQ